MPIKPISSILAICICTFSFFSAGAQYYAYIEAEGQQPFYLRIGSKLYSSNSSGFLILPKLAGTEIPLKIGFPENAYPEVGFTMLAASKDRGFFLKLVDGAGWTLIEKGNTNQISGKVLGLSSDVADSKGLKVEAEQVVAEIQSAQVSIDNKLLGDKNGQLEMIYLEKQAGGKVDTIYVQIEKRLITETTVPEPPVQMKIPNKCTGTPADVRDVRNLQKKLLGITDEENQLALVVRTFMDKCFTCKQTLEVAWFFVTEQARLKLFRQIMPLVSDSNRFPELEEAFLSDEGIEAFRQMLGLKY
jgi:hypothetical protein